jgi:hypothetical protein
MHMLIKIDNISRVINCNANKIVWYITGLQILCSNVGFFDSEIPIDVEVYYNTTVLFYILL